MPQSPPPHKRPPALRRAWLFVPGNGRDIEAAAACGADVVIQELEDFTPPDQRPPARARARGLYDGWRAAGAVAAVRVNMLDGDGPADLAGVMAGRPDVVLLPKVTAPEEIAALDAAITGHERALGLTPGAIEIVPNIETARGLVRIQSILAASRRVSAALLASEDMAADLGVERTREGAELAYVRSRFLVEARAANVVAIDRPYTFADLDGCVAETREARRLGFIAKSAVSAAHVGAINAALTPDAAEVGEAKALVAAFDAARAAGAERATYKGVLVEAPRANAAHRLIARAEALASWR